MTFTSFWYRRGMIFAKGILATYKHIRFKLHLQAGSCTSWNSEKKDKTWGNCYLISNNFVLIVADKVGWNSMETEENTRKINKIREKQPAYKIKNATEQIKIEVKYFVERLSNAANARNICWPLPPKNLLGSVHIIFKTFPQRENWYHNTNRNCN